MKTLQHLGLTPWDFKDLGAHNLVRQAQVAERLGYQSIWLPENHFGENALPDPLMLLATVAGGTQTIQLGTTSYLLTLRNPLQAAEQVAVLDQLSAGRVILGVGRGYAPDMLRAFHVPAKEKRRIFAWTLELMRKAWRGEAVSLNEDDADAVLVYPQPVQQPEPKLWVAAFGPKALAQAGRLGLPYLCSPMESLSVLKTNYQAHRDASEAAEVTPADEVPLMRCVYVDDDESRLSKLRAELQATSDNSRMQAGEGVDDWTIIGTPNQVQDKLAQYEEELGMTHLIATRLRVQGMETEQLENSVAQLAEIVAHR